MGRGEGRRGKFLDRQSRCRLRTLVLSDQMSPLLPVVNITSAGLLWELNEMEQLEATLRAWGCSENGLPCHLHLQGLTSSYRE